MKESSHRAVVKVVAPHREMLSEVVVQLETALNRNTFLEATSRSTRIASSNGCR